MTTTGERIRMLRTRMKLTLDDVAKYLGVGRQAIYKYEHGTVTNIPLENIEKMAELFNVSPGYLSGWSPDYIVRDLDLQRFSEAPSAPCSSDEAKIISSSVDKMPPEERKRALAIMQAAFSPYFDKEE